MEYKLKCFNKRRKTGKSDHSVSPSTSHSTSLVAADKLVLDDTTFYSILLHSYVTEKEDTFLMPDFDIRRRRLKVSKFLVLKQRFVYFNDERRAVFSCSCSNLRRQFVEDLPRVVHQPYNEVFQQLYCDCLHIKAIERLCTDDGEEEAVENDHSYTSADTSETVQFHEVWGFPDHTAVEVEGTFGVILKKRCLVCSSTHCKHIRAVAESEDCDGSGHHSDIVPKIPYVGYSTAVIPMVSITPTKIKQTYAVSSEGLCACGTPWEGAEQLQQPKTIFTDTAILPCNVLELKCRNCQNILHYDGSDDGLLHLGRILMAHSVMRNYMRHFVTDGTPIHCGYKIWYWQLLDAAADVGKLSYRIFQQSWYLYMDLLEVNNGGFTCNICGQQPSVVVMDGVSVSFRKTFLPITATTCITNSTVDNLLTGSSHNERVFLPDQQTRKLMKNLCVAGLTNEEFGELKTCLKYYEPALLPVVEDFENPLADLQKCPAALQDLLKALSANSPVCAILPVIIQDSVSKIIKKERLNMECLQELQKWAPIFYQAYCAGIPSSFLDVLEIILSRASAAKRVTTHNLPQSVAEGELSYFPTLPSVCVRGTYTMDRKRKHSDGCQKNPGKGHRLTRGLFTLSCHHGICFGFEIMPDVESPDVAFTVLRTRFHAAPSIIIYDNACNLHSYCLNRDPGFFADSCFFVDRFHWRNHVGCSEGYNMSNHQHLENVNSEVAEQRNSTLIKLKGMVSYMTMNNYKKHLMLFMYFRNNITNARNGLSQPREGLYEKLSALYSKLHC